MITITKALYPDMVELCANLRSADRAELMASLGHTNADTLWELTGRHETHAARAANGDLVSVYGVSPHPLQQGVGIPWLLGTPHLFSFPKSLHKIVSATLPIWQLQYPILTNQTDKRNTRVLLWLQRLGFHFVGISPGRADPSVPFIQFVRNSNVRSRFHLDGGGGRGIGCRSG